MTVRLGLVCAAAAALLTGCTVRVEGAPLRAATEPPYQPPGVVDADQVLLTQAQMRAITGGGEDLSIIPGMDGRAPVDVDALAEAVPADCRFIFAETATFGPDVADFHKTSFQHPRRRALISEAAAAYGDKATARTAFETLAAAGRRCADGSHGPLLVGQVDAGADSLSTRVGACGRDYRVESSVMVEVTFCGYPESVPAIVMTNIVNKIPHG
ncbi:sensor domain-containing protein [Mycolicibacterium sp. CBM1]